MGGSQSVMSYAEACDVLDDAELRTLLATWDRWRADEQLLSRDALCKGFVRPDLSGPLATRLHVLLREPAADAAAGIAAQRFVAGCASLLRGTWPTRARAFAALFAGEPAAARRSDAPVREAPFVALWAASVALGRALGFAPRCARNAASVAALVARARDELRSFAQRAPAALSAREFGEWADGGRAEPLLLYAYALERSVFGDALALPPEHPLRAVQATDAVLAGGDAPAVLALAELTTLGRHLPPALCPPASSFLPFFCTERNGFSLRQLIAMHDKLIKTNRVIHSGLLLAVRDASGRIFGAFTSDPLRLRHDEPYGDAHDSFLFRRRRRPDAAGDDAPSEIEVFSSRGAAARSDNIDCLHYVEDDELPGGFGIGIGGRAGYFGLFLDSSFVGGHTHPVSTFSNRALNDDSDDETAMGGDFRIATVEAYAFARPVDHSVVPGTGEEDEMGILDRYGEEMFILELIGKGHSTQVRN